MNVIIRRNALENLSQPVRNVDIDHFIPILYTHDKVIMPHKYRMVIGIKFLCNSLS